LKNCKAGTREAVPAFSPAHTHAGSWTRTDQLGYEISSRQAVQIQVQVAAFGDVDGYEREKNESKPGDCNTHRRLAFSGHAEGLQNITI
jgi:hypothetical protein